MKKNKKPQIFITLMLIIGFLGTSIISYFVSRTSIRNQISNKQLPLTSDNVYSEVQNDLLKPIFISSLMASDTFLRDWVLGGEKDVTKIEKYLKEMKVKYHVLSSFFVSENTKNYYYSDGILKKINPNSKRDVWYYRVRKMVNDYEINVDIDMANHDYLTIFINYKVYDYEGKYIGVTGVGLQVDKVNNIIANYQRRYSSKIHFIDKNGIIKLSSSEPINSPYHTDLKKYRIHDMSSYDINTFSYKNNGENILVNIRFISEFKWYLIVEQSDKNETKVLLSTLMINSIITFFISVIIILIISNHWRKHQIQLEEIAHTDKLTGVYNRMAFEIEINSLIKEIKKFDNTFSMLSFDIDNFKYVNDTYGHLEGDKILKNIIKTVSISIENKYKIFRWGGDEFIILLNNKTNDEAFKIAEKIRTDINREKEFSNMNITLSLGVTEYKKGENIDSLIKRTDELMYISKSKGKNKTEYN